MKTEQELQLEARKGDLFRALKSSNEYKEFIKVLSDMYSEALQELIEKDSLESRIKMKTIDELISKIDNDIRISDMAHEDLMNKRFINQPR